MNIYTKLINMGKETQIAKSFDKATIVKVSKGALIAGTGSAALYLVDFVGGIDFTNTNLAAITAFAVPFMVNLIKEYMKGE